MPALRFRAVDVPPKTELLWGLEQHEIDSILAAVMGDNHTSRATTIRIPDQRQ